jgi:pyrroloquinoline quinone biosynthesis protein E
MDTSSTIQIAGGAGPGTAPRPFGLLAELTYRCPLHCPYCSNPTRYPPTKQELTVEVWQRVLDEAADLGVFHVLFSGGEPLLYPELPELVAHARAAGLYTNLITSSIGLTQERAESLKTAGLDSIQISFQAHEASLGNSIAGAIAHERKREAAQMVRAIGLPLTLNVVLHRGNIDWVAELIALAEESGAERLELANTQFYGWAFRNKEALLPSRGQIEAADRIALAAQRRLRGRMEILYVLPDYFGEFPKPCMNGWGQRYLTVNPIGDVLPCPTAGEIPGMKFESVREHALSWIWEQSEAFNRFRGTDWMPEPCRNCDRRAIDFGGCRCQAALLTGEAAITDPVCALSPHHDTIVRLVDSADGNVPEPRAFLNSRGDFSHLQFRTNPT